MIELEQSIEIFESIAKKYFNVAMGFNATQQAPYLLYEISFSKDEFKNLNDNDFLKSQAPIFAIFTSLVVYKSYNDIKKTQLEMFKTLQELKKELLNADFFFVSLDEAIAFDEKGYAIDSPAKQIVFKILVKF